ncbi:imidazole glycerol phosphate synthase subunit HisH [Patescibacteria group bacterium]|nr:imidazole glycerol phosphate synthase subunit HisH [Patescibacteria group bacterium]
MMDRKIGIISYSAGNIGSIQRALDRLCIPYNILKKPEDLSEVDGVIFPGAGAAGNAMQSLKCNNWIDAIKNCKNPFLGICLGMQLLFEYSEENSTDCIGAIKGRVIGLPNTLVRPHMGWNKLNSGDYAYFMHSYVCEPEDAGIITMSVSYGKNICAGIRKGNFIGVQWHPEKSGALGDDFLLNFYKLCK